jgi:hypothetical protein
LNEDLKKLSTGELKKKETQLKGITAFLIGIMIVGLAASVYLIITTKKFTGGLVISLSMAAILFTNYKNLKTLREEIKSRE